VEAALLVPADATSASVHLLCVTSLHSRFSLKLPPVFTTTAFPLFVNNSRYQKSLMPPLKHYNLGMLDYCGRGKNDADLTTYYQKPQNGYSKADGILATNPPAILTVCSKTFPCSFC